MFFALLGTMSILRKHAGGGGGVWLMLTVRKHSVNVSVKSAEKLKIMLTGGGGGVQNPKIVLT